MNLVICAAFLLLVCIFVFSFAVVRNMLTDVSNRDMEKVIANSRTAREISKVFADIELLTIRFYGKNDYLESEGKRLAHLIEDIGESVADPVLETSFGTLSGHLDSFTSQCVQVNEVLKEIESIDHKIHAELTLLETAIGDLLLKNTLEGDDTSFAEQLLALAAGYRETLLHIGKLCAELRQEHDSPSQEGKISDLMSVIDDFMLRLRTITASVPNIAGYGDKILNHVRQYKQAVSKYDYSMRELGVRMKSLRHSGKLSLSAMDDIDKEISRTTQLASGNIEKIFFTAGAAILTVSAFVIISLGFGTAFMIKSNIENPMKSILSGVDLFGKGILTTPIKLDRNDEWGTIANALDNMACNLGNNIEKLERAQSRLAQSEKRLQEDLDGHIEELERTQTQLIQNEKMTAMGQLAAGVAHEMNNPLTGVTMYAELMKDRIDSFPGEIDPHFRKFPRQLELIMTAARRCKAISDNLLDFSRQDESEMTKVDLAGVLDKTFGLLNTQLRHKRISLKKEVPENVRIYGNGNQLQQVFTNVVLNAAQAIESNGEISVKATSGNEVCMVEVSDTGSGIPKECLDRIFDPFFTTKPIGKGTGLGLSIVYGIVEKHGGKITVDSTPGKGTTFNLMFPLLMPVRDV